MFLNFLEGVKITSIGLKLVRPQLQHWLLFLEHDPGLDLKTCTNGSWIYNDPLVVAGLPVPMGSTVFRIQFETHPVLLILSNAGSNLSSCGI